MKINNLENLMISISEVKKKLSEVINDRMTKIIVKNNTPVSVIMPYTEYTELLNEKNEKQQNLQSVGQEITLKNGVKVMVCVEHTDEDIIIKTFKKMKTSGDYKLHFTQTMSIPSYEETLTTDELMNFWLKNTNEI